MWCNVDGSHVLTFKCSYLAIKVFHWVQIEKSRSPHEPYKVSKVETLVCEEVKIVEHLHLSIPC